MNHDRAANYSFRTEQCKIWTVESDFQLASLFYFNVTYLTWIDYEKKSLLLNAVAFLPICCERVAQSICILLSSHQKHEYERHAFQP